MSANVIYAPYLHTQTTPAAVWSVTHGFGRDVNVAVYVGDVQAFPRIEPDGTNPTTVINISFFEKGVPVAVAGKAVIS
jgi:hypothetical protein